MCYSIIYRPFYETKAKNAGPDQTRQHVASDPGLHPFSSQNVIFNFEST